MATLYFPKRTFTIIPEGTHIFRIYDVEYNVTFGKVIVRLVNAKGDTHTAYYNILNEDGSTNESACNSLAYLSRAAINDAELTEIDHAKLIDKYIVATVEHTVVPKRDDPTKTHTFVKLTEIMYAEGFDTEPCEKAMTLGSGNNTSATNDSTVTQQMNSGAMDLDNLLD